MARVPRVKICGITTAQEATLAAEAGADAIGLVFHERSPRHLDPDRAARIIAATPAFVTVVGLFMNPERRQLETLLQILPLELLQFHGRESGAFCRSFGRRYIKAVGMSGNPDMDSIAGEYGDAAALLVDSHAGDRDGGSGETFDWSRWPEVPDRRLILAGGLNPGNVGQAIRELRPWGVDVSSGVESAPGRKDPEKMQQFIQEVHRVRESH
ncbi:phosphoribosylanthranilate isomerase [Natronospira bacteriovora]|uniref:N-(5'-phosphoribosyl)anthranilate isomerase n=1 Tax=Natronospira bacteriovora TaxID=3069753 RepID=A0ABU0W4P7_9GAMM|nr:phosphoribosylanthranilate isomerase [Natronospira sp. AB-CW4]MDQ2068924.1 phosphoribosylanthranilate isomerase [Natronospira sp. AB-CW4]